eukprot:jgi/Mesvir1/14264/Mv25158-RA.1
MAEDFFSPPVLQEFQTSNNAQPWHKYSSAKPSKLETSGTPDNQTTPRHVVVVVVAHAGDAAHRHLPATHMGSRNLETAEGQESEDTEQYAITNVQETKILSGDMYGCIIGSTRMIGTTVVRPSKRCSAEYRYVGSRDLVETREFFPVKWVLSLFPYQVTCVFATCPLKLYGGANFRKNLTLMLANSGQIRWMDECMYGWMDGLADFHPLFLCFLTCTAL